jgi:hypothetical protein
MIKILGTVVALALIVFMAFPFARDAYHRYEVAQRLKPLMNDQDAAAFRDWTGDPASFGQRLYERCLLTYGEQAPNCNAYKVAMQ